MPSPPTQPISLRFLTGPAKAWLTVVGVLASFDGFAWMTIHGLTTAPCYEMAVNFAAPEVWGWAMLASGILSSVSVWADGHRWAIEAGRLGLALYGVITFVIGLSSLGVALVRPNMGFAAVTVTKWWGVSLACFVVLAGPTIATSTRASLQEWFQS